MYFRAGCLLCRKTRNGECRQKPEGWHTFRFENSDLSGIIGAYLKFVLNCKKIPDHIHNKINRLLNRTAF